jgi:N-(2-amino-2-carboxyethyl)-L-glutamate synthase
MTTRSGRVLDELLPREIDSANTRKVVDVLAETVASYPKTPVASFDVIVAGRRRRIHLKLEGLSPWGSIKGRTAVGLLASVAPLVTDRSRLIESTSGNLGVAMAGLCRKLALPFTAVVDDRLPVRMDRRMRELGAELLAVDATRDGEDDLLASRLRLVSKVCALDDNAIWTNQYENPANPLIHAVWTGPELLAQLPQVQAIVVAASTGGTLAGLARATRFNNPNIMVVGADVVGSRVFGGQSGRRVLTGVGAGRPSQHLQNVICDAVEIVPSWHGVARCREWHDKTGLSLGGSSGVVLAAAFRCLAARPELTTVACLCPDLGDNYAETIYDDGWVRFQRAAVARDDDCRLEPLPSVELIQWAWEAKPPAPQATCARPSSVTVQQ